VICETKCIGSHYLLLDREKNLPDLALSFRTRAGPLQPIDATMQLCRTDYPAPRDWSAALTIAHAGLQGFSTANKVLPPLKSLLSASAQATPASLR
jgi:hypothetical protein